MIQHEDHRHNFLLNSTQLAFSFILFAIFSFFDATSDFLCLYIFFNGLLYIFLNWKFPIKSIILGGEVMTFLFLGAMFVPQFLIPIIPPPNYTSLINNYNPSFAELFGHFLLLYGLIGLFILFIRTEGFKRTNNKRRSCNSLACTQKER